MGIRGPRGRAERASSGVGAVSLAPPVGAALVNTEEESVWFRENRSETYKVVSQCSAIAVAGLPCPVYKDSPFESC